jgi:SAM-dependent MidA family methyltransferase
LVDVTSPLRDQQRSRLARCGQRVHWHDTPAEAIEATGGRALIWSNELIDAFPATVLRWCCENPNDPTGGRWQELWIETDPRGLREIWREFYPSSLTLPSNALDPAAWPGGAPTAGQRIELHDRIVPWLAGWLPRWHVGSLLTIDYGDLFPALYHRRPGGTLRGYSHHQRVEGGGIYHRMGRQDLTADVNFTDLRNWTESMGLQTAVLATQAEFIQHLRPRNRPLTSPTPDSP